MGFEKLFYCLGGRGGGFARFLTKNGRGCYVIMDIAEYEKYERYQAELWLMSELEKGRKSGEEEGWLTLDEVKARLQAKRNEE